MSDGAIALDWTTIAGGGFVASLLFLALVERLRRTFAARAELDAAGRRLERLSEKLAAMGEIQAAQAAALEHLLQRLDRLDSAGGAPSRRPRRA